MEKEENKNTLKLENFLQQSAAYIQNFVCEKNILTVYLPIDGTRRYFIQETGLDYTSDDFFSKYFEFTRNKLIDMLQMIFNLGIKNVIVLLMDHTSFKRDSDYLINAIKLGVEPLFFDNSLETFYKNFEINLMFAGFNQIYSDFGFDYLLTRINYINSIVKQDAKRNLIFYTAPINDSDIINLAIKNYELNGILNLDNNNLESLVFEELYPKGIPQIDFSIFYGYPRFKPTPHMLMNSSVNFYIANPSLSLSEIQLRKSIYYVWRAQTSIKDEYYKYEHSNLDLKIEKNSDNLLGEEWYSDF